MNERTQLFKQRWIDDPVFKETRDCYINDSYPMGMSPRQWYLQRCPKCWHHLQEDYCPDARGINLSNLIFGATSLSNSCFEDADLSNCTFNSTGFQSALFTKCNFQGSHLIDIQGTPTYAHKANFTDCVIERGTFHGIAAAMRGPGHLCDFTNANFTRCRATSTSFHWCDFRGANFTDVEFIDCDLSGSDLRGVNFLNAKIQDCDMRNALLRDHATVRRFIESCTVENKDKIVWYPD